MMKLFEVSKNGKTLLCGHGEDEDLKTPIKIEFIIDERVYKKLVEATKERKWNIYDALCMMCEYCDDFIGEMDLNPQNYFHAD